SFSSSSVFKPARAKCRAAVVPPGPEPTTITSYECIMKNAERAMVGMRATAALGIRHWALDLSSERLQRGAQFVFEGFAWRAARCALRFRRAVTEIDERRRDFAVEWREFGDFFFEFDFAFEFEHEALRGLFADAANAAQNFEVALRDGAANFIGRRGRENAERDFGSDARNAQQHFKQIEFIRCRKTEQGKIVFAHVRVNMQRDWCADIAETFQRGSGYARAIPDAVDIHDDGIGRAF